MREIKFRAWHKINKQYIYDIQITQDYYHDFETFLEDDNYIVEQYTGLKDKNGVEIYEGDKCGYEYYNPITGEITTNEQFIIYFIYDTMELEILLEDENCYNLTVIGNIHEAQND